MSNSNETLLLGIVKRTNVNVMYESVGGSVDVSASINAGSLILPFLDLSGKAGGSLAGKKTDVLVCSRDAHNIDSNDPLPYSAHSLSGFSGEIGANIEVKAGLSLPSEITDVITKIELNAIALNASASANISAGVGIKGELLYAYGNKRKYSTSVKDKELIEWLKNPKVTQNNTPGKNHYSTISRWRANPIAIAKASAGASFGVSTPSEIISGVGAKAEVSAGAKAEISRTETVLHTIDSSDNARCSYMKYTFKKVGAEINAGCGLIINNSVNIAGPEKNANFVFVNTLSYEGVTTEWNVNTGKMNDDRCYYMLGVTLSEHPWRKLFTDHYGEESKPYIDVLSQYFRISKERLTSFLTSEDVARLINELLDKDTNNIAATSLFLECAYRQPKKDSEYGLLEPESYFDEQGKKLKSKELLRDMRGLGARNNDKRFEAFRIRYMLNKEDKKKLGFGFGLHIGETGFDFEINKINELSKTEMMTLYDSSSQEDIPTAPMLH